MTTRILVVAKSPVSGLVKTRLGAEIGMDRAAELAAAALLDTLRACTAAVGAEHCRLSLAGNLADSVYGDLLSAALDGWGIAPQRGTGFDERLALAHLDLAAEGPGVVVQIGMDTPQLTADHLRAVADGVAREGDDTDAVLAEAEDGGWWALGLTDARHGGLLRGVAMSTPTTAADTRTALEDAGLRVASGPVLRDVDTLADAEAVAAVCAEGSEFARVWGSVR